VSVIDVPILRLLFLAGISAFLVWLGKKNGLRLLNKYPSWFGTKEDHQKEQLRRQKKPKLPKEDVITRWKKLK